LVELSQRPEDRQSDLVRGNLRRAAPLERVLDLLAEARELIGVDRPALAGLADPVDDLLPAERLGRAGALHDRELHLLDGGEALLADRALPAPAGRSPAPRPPACGH